MFHIKIRRISKLKTTQILTTLNCET